MSFALLAGMSRHLRKILVLLLLSLIACGGGSSGSNSSSGLGPIVDAGSLPSGSSSGGGCEFLFAYGSEQRLELALSAVVNGLSPISLDLQFNSNHAPSIFTGNEHDIFNDPPNEPQTRLNFEITTSTPGVSLPNGLIITFAIWDDVRGISGTWPSVTAISDANGIEIIAPTCTQGGATCLGSFDDTFPYIGRFDFIDLPPEIDWNNQTLVAQACTAGAEITGRANPVNLYSNPIFFKIIPGMP